MDASQDLAQQTRGQEEEDDALSSNHNISLVPNFKKYKKWVQIFTYISFVLIGQASGTLLGRLYFDKGGNSIWIGALVQNCGFPLIFPLIIFFPYWQISNTNPQPSVVPQDWNSRYKIFKLIFVYFSLGLLMAANTLMYSYGLQYLPVSTYSLLCASQLSFNAITSYFINAQKLSALIINSVVILSISSCLLAINGDNEGDYYYNLGKSKYIIGFLCTLGASAMYSLGLSLTQYSFEKVIKDESFYTLACMQFYPSLVATSACVIGLFGSGEWRDLKGEMRNFKGGSVLYVIILTFTAISWEAYSIGLLGLILEVSSLFSNVISTLGLPLVPILGMVFFQDKMNGIKVISLVLAMWGFVSYFYQHHLDKIEASKTET